MRSELHISSLRRLVEQILPCRERRPSRLTRSSLSMRLLRSGRSNGVKEKRFQWPRNAGGGGIEKEVFLGPYAIKVRVHWNTKSSFPGGRRGSGLTSERFHQPPPRAWNSAAVSA